jgi:D-glycero-alpha-D-manno-heptose-7-phosphate kinase
MTVHYEMNLPWGAGLGSSAAKNVLWMGLVRRKPTCSVQERLALAEDAYMIEKLLGYIGGKQDQYASAVGGINLLEFDKNGIRSTPVDLSPDCTKQLESMLLLCYTRAARLSSRIHENVWGRYYRGGRGVIDALIHMRDLAFKGRDSLENEVLDAFGKTLSMQFNCSIVLDSSTSNQALEHLFSLVCDDVLGGKPCGAGGGRCVVLCCKGERARKRAEEKISRLGWTSMDFTLDSTGLQVTIVE